MTIVVLILVVMEDSLGRPYYYCCWQYLFPVLILVVMEDSLGQQFRELLNQQSARVLILVVMEDSLGHIEEKKDYVQKHIES